MTGEGQGGWKEGKKRGSVGGVFDDVVYCLLLGLF